MLCLAIHVYEQGKTQPAPTVRAPLSVVRTMVKLVPNALAAKLKQNGVDLDQIVDEASTKLEPGTLLDIADDEQRIVIVIEHMPSEYQIRKVN